MNLLESAAGGVRFATLFSEQEILEAMLRYEVALADCQAELGMIPRQAANIISRAAADFPVDADVLARDGALAGSLAIPFVKALRSHVASLDAHAASHLHFGCTSQDVLDSAVALCAREAVHHLERQLADAAAAARALALDHRDSPMLARTLLQAAGVTTFGHKAAQWHIALSDGRRRLLDTAADALAVSLGGSLGNLSAYGPDGAPLRAAVAERLGLRDPGFTWHTLRHRWVGLACDVALCCGTLAKIAHDLALLSQSEVGEVEEPAAEGRGGSSALPHKRNPALALQILALTRPVPGWVANLLAAMPQEQERALGAWQSELAQWPAILRNACAAGQALAELLGGLVVRADRCVRNIENMQGVIFAERAAEVLTPSLGKARAAELLAVLCDRALRESTPLADLLRTHVQAEPGTPPVRADALDLCFSLAFAIQGSARQVDDMLRGSG